MAVKVILNGTGEEPTVEPQYVLRSKADYTKVGYAVARWARESLRNARLKEGGDRFALFMEVEFFSEDGRAEKLADATEDQSPKRKRKKAAK